MTELEKLDGYFRAANYLSACQLYLLDNPLLKRSLVKEDIKKKIVGHWGTVPGQNFVYTHLNRIINNAKKRQNKAIKENEKGFGINPNNKINMRISDDYIPTYSLINNNVINIEAKNIKEQVHKSK